MATIPEEIVTVLNRLPLDEQRRVLAFAQNLAQSIPAPRSVLPPGMPIQDLLQFLPALPREAIDEMERAINEDCERIEIDDQ